jgi:hypothetical protein
MAAGRRASTAKLVHNIVLSMPAGTPPQKLLAASREFAREEFALQHRYALVLQHGPGSSSRSSGGQRAQAGRWTPECPQAGFASLAGAVRAAASEPGR